MYGVHYMSFNNQHTTNSPQISTLHLHSTTTSRILIHQPPPLHPPPLLHRPTPRIPTRTLPRPAKLPHRLNRPTWHRKQVPQQLLLIHLPLQPDQAIPHTRKRKPIEPPGVLDLQLQFRGVQRYWVRGRGPGGSRRDAD